VVGLLRVTGPQYGFVVSGEEYNIKFLSAPASTGSRSVLRYLGQGRNIPVTGLLEVCAFNVHSCLVAQRAGAARVELCDNPVEGGTTPSYGTVRRARERIGIRLYPIIRPRSGNYYYDDDEWDIIRQDIAACKDLGCDGISVGAATIDAAIDTERMQRIVAWAYPMGVTCNRVFDGTPDLVQALEDLILCGCERVLTSGGRSSAPDAGAMLARLVQQAGDRICVMPGAGITSSNLAQLRRACGAREYHASARTIAPNPLRYVNTEVRDYGQVYVADEAEVRRMVAILAVDG
jgi:copper homeostasis protein